MAKGTTVKMWRRTMGILIGLIIIGFGAILFSLVRIQLIDGQRLQKAAVDQQLKDTTIEAQRGTIYDVNGNVMAESATVWQVVLEPNYLKVKASEKDSEAKTEQRRRAVAQGLAPILGMSEEDIYEATKANTWYKVIKKQVETDVKDQILELKQKLLDDIGLGGGIRLETDYKRYYPNGTLASTILGFVNSNGGSGGVEQYYNDYLTGTAGRLVTAKNALGTDMPFQYEQMVDAKNGDNLILSVDMKIQHTLEKYLDEGVANNKVANRGTGIIMNVKTGEILAMAVSGDFDPNDPAKITDEQTLQAIAALPAAEQEKAKQEARYAQWRNKAVSDTYYPGSVFKMLTMSMALEENKVNESYTFTCGGSYHFPYANVKPINCWRRGGHGAQTLTEGLCNSCNPLFITLGEMLGVENFVNYFEAFGLSEKTGIDVPGESTGISKGREDMGPVDLAVYAFGQNFSITPIQMITACAAVANGGYLVQPHLVSKIVDADGNIVKSVDTNVKRQVISEDVSKRVTAMLHQNATIGTAKNGYVAGYRVCGKTGTSEKVDQYNKDKANGVEPLQMKYIASYCGFAPADDPEVAMLIFFDEPMGSNYYGGSVAGPVFAQVMSEVLPYLNIEPQYTEEELANMDGSAPDVINNTVDQAKNKVQSEGYTPKVYGDGDTVIAQIPEPGETIPKEGTVVLYTDAESQERTVTVPKLTGLTLSQVNREATNAGIQVHVTGAALTTHSAVTSSNQSVEPGQKVKPGTVITVNFIEVDQVQ